MNRYYAASQNRVERKLLRGRLSAFCMSRDYFKKEQLQVGATALTVVRLATSKREAQISPFSKTSGHMAPSHIEARPAS